MNMKLLSKKTMVLFMVLTLVAGAIAGCGGSGDNSKKKADMQKMVDKMN